MKEAMQEDLSFYHADPDAARIYEALAYAQDFTSWDDVNAHALQTLALDVV